MMLLTRRHRAFTLSLAAIAGGIFVIFISRVYLAPSALAPPRDCSISTVYDGLLFTKIQRRYHYAMEQMLEERMRLYEGTTPLQCQMQNIDAAIPKGEYAEKVALALPSMNRPSPPAPPPAYFGYLKYSDFEKLLFEFWREYDCHLRIMHQDLSVLARAFAHDPIISPATPLIAIPFIEQQFVERERERARRTYDRVLYTIRSSEQYLPLHASLRCLQRGAVDMRNAFGLISTASQCLVPKLGSPNMSLLK